MIKKQQCLVEISMYSTGKTSGSSLHICRNLSGRAEECSGPWKQQQKSNEQGKWWKDEIMDFGWKDLTMPSMPWGSSNTMPFCRTHLAWPGEMNWSMMHWAVLLKSPNWASQSTRAFGLAMAKPSSKPTHNDTQTWGHACSVGIKCGTLCSLFWVCLTHSNQTQFTWFIPTKNAIFWQGAVTHGIRSLVRVDVVHGNAGPFVDVLIM